MLFFYLEVRGHPLASYPVQFLWPLAAQLLNPLPDYSTTVRSRCEIAFLQLLNLNWHPDEFLYHSRPRPLSELQDAPAPRDMSIQFLKDLYTEKVSL